MKSLDQIKITYCSNIHPTGGSLENHLKEIYNVAPQLRKALGYPEGILMPIGLRLSAEAIQNLENEAQIKFLKEALAQNGLYIPLINGFPYGEFNAGIIKAEVHLPDWQTQERVNYTISLCKILAHLLPENQTSGGVSTNPISYKPFFGDNLQKQWEAMVIAAYNFGEVASACYDLYKQTGKTIHIDIEPEPDGVLETIEEYIDFYDGYLMTYAKERVMEKQNCSSSEAEKILQTHLTICFDVCHFAVNFQEPVEVLKKLRERTLSLGRIQISSALEINISKSTDIELLNQFNEPRYLHQVRLRRKEDGKIFSFTDIEPAKNFLTNNPNFQGLLRTHFHVPIFAELALPYRTLQTEIQEVMAFYKENNESCWLEVETYTWEVLPSELKKSLPENLIQELQYIHAL